MSTVQQRTGVRLRRWTKAEYYRLGDLGFFHCQRVELIEGRLVVYSPQNPLHANTVCRVGEVLRILFSSEYCIRCQLPLDLGQDTEPEPDFSVVVAGDYSRLHPTTAELIVEVSDTTLSHDRNRKGSLYARAGIADYWIVNPVDHQLEVYRDPVADPTQAYGHRYSTRQVLTPPAAVSPLAVPRATASVADLV